MKYTNHVNTVCERQVKDDVFVDDKTPQIRINLRTRATESWSSRQKCESFVNSRCEPVGVDHAIFGDVRPDFREIEQCARAFANDRHLFFSVVSGA